jgi:hypothetical protein
MRPILSLSLVLVATLPVKHAPADEMTMSKPAQSMPMAGMTEMMSSKPGFRLYGWIETGITGNFAFPNDNQNFGGACLMIVQMNRSSINLSSAANAGSTRAWLIDLIGPLH